ncbi:hypothetical protein WN55_04549 [Dufourea novaeangliae]|uniref:DPY30 domain-containing protein 2 n=1 Tax=Dufourea novaeangliae TaxID=178035 RepID=A0A154P0Z6_DUFNO|nr:hypothetical protein WN55_04549 [Dufourea novaeangliae]
MKKERPPPNDIRVPHPLSIFADRIRLHGGGSKQSVKELLMSQLSPPRCQIDFLLTAANLGKCNAPDDEKTEESGDSNDNNKLDQISQNNFKADNVSKKNDEEKVVGDEEEEVKCLNCLMDDLELSLDSEWLRNYFKLPLTMAIKEIVTRKPCDPINYLGFWLLNYRKCQEKAQWQADANRELDYYRSLVREPVQEEERVSVDTGEVEEEEELARDWNFKHYESGQNTT